VHYFHRLSFFGCRANIIFSHANKVLAADKNLVYFCNQSTRMILETSDLAIEPTKFLGISRDKVASFMNTV